MGAAGTGMGSSPAMPAGTGGLSPQLLAMLAQMGGQGASGFTPPPGPMPGQGAGTPMAAYLGAMGGMPQSGGGAMAPHPMGAPPVQGGPQGMAPGAVPNASQMGVPQMQALLAQLKGTQGGVPAQQSAAGAMPVPPNAAGVPSAQAMNPNWLQQLLGQNAGMAPGGPGN